ncbi:MAG: T9SS type A sorting domain-containing protein [Ignavibacteria bacterium]|nr:T9SS type A sorting domain-containing protein [Ignavibacteria bacterium]
MVKYSKLIILFLFISCSINAQQGSEHIKILTTGENYSNAELENITNKLNEARNNNDEAKIDELIHRLKSVYGETKTVSLNDIIVSQEELIHGKLSQFSQVPDLSYIDGSKVKAVATHTLGTSNTIFAATTKYFSSSFDVISVYASYDQGVTWTLKGHTFTTLNVKFNTGELDIEPVVRGSDTVLLCAAGISRSRHRSAAFFSFNFTTGAQGYNIWDHWGSGNMNVNVYNPRITSDNSVYEKCFIYISVAVDSMKADGNKNIYQRLALVLNPLDNSVPITYRNSQSFYWYATTPNLNSHFLWHDICYYRTSSPRDRMFTVFNVTGYSAIQAAYSENYCVSAAGNSFYTDGFKIDQVQIVSCGGRFNYNTAIIYRVLADNVHNYDFRCLYSSNGETSLHDFTNSYIESSGSVAVEFIDVQAVKFSQGKYKFAYTDSNSTDIHYRGNIDPSSYEPVSTILADPVNGIKSYGKMRAGYINREWVDCMLLYFPEFSANTICAVNFCDKPISSQKIEKDKILFENYPNPFNPVTTIKFTIPAESNVKIKVYDLLGKEIKTLLNENLKSGTHNVNFDGSEIASGTYFYSIEAGEFRDIKKMVLIK